MNSYIGRLNQYLEENPFDSGQRGIDNILDYLTECYLEDNPIADETIKAIQEEMSPYYDNIPLVASERLFVLVYTLCGAYESAAFRAGLQVGVHLQKELENMG